MRLFYILLLMVVLVPASLPAATGEAAADRTEGSESVYPEKKESKSVSEKIVKRMRNLMTHLNTCGEIEDL